MNTGSALPGSYGFVAIDSTGLLYSASAAAGSQGAAGAQGTDGGHKEHNGTIGAQGNTGTQQEHKVLVVPTWNANGSTGCSR